MTPINLVCPFPNFSQITSQLSSAEPESNLRRRVLPSRELCHPIRRWPQEPTKDIVIRTTNPDAIQISLAVTQGWQNLKHDHILNYSQVIHDCRTPVFIQPVCNNGNIVDYYIRAYSQDQLPITLREAAQGLQFLHSQGITHGRVHGSNILMDDEGHAKITDFGLYPIVNPLAGDIRDPFLWWKAPEQLIPTDGPEILHGSFEADVYSFGLTIIEVCTSRRPFADIQHPIRFLMELSNNVEFAMTIPKPARIPEDLWSTFRLCCAGKPEMRPCFAGLVFFLLSQDKTTSAGVTSTM
ncbi:hypothetical protein JAAARDRAFT_206824 [Jaapia argillacea MUCL 33604]|uniref:Protein kinase domain-containing protein n=1 Tax=Jaapia argillacea MUCL 33604 TaxID=933084 RepID=A0A067PW57_9AGAM|nr:hypothetical protein JAAARDRAFT_206824 [Jaapia argillacea MUCL 33604]